MKKYYIYGHFDTNGMCRYVGSGRKERIKEKRGRNKKYNEIFKDCIPEYKIFEEVFSKEEAILKENFYIIKMLEGGHLLTNILKGHHKDPKSYDDETRKMMSDLAKRFGKSYWLGKKRDPETMRKLQEKAHTKEAIEKRRQKMLGRILSEEHKNKLSIAQKGRKVTEETKEKLRIINKGKISPCRGRKLSEEHKFKISKATMGRRPLTTDETKKRLETWAKRCGGKIISKKTIKVRNNETGQIYRCADDAAKDLGYKNGKGIQACCSGKFKTYKKIHWEYVKE